MSGHRIYLGGFSPHPEVLFLKAGMTSNLTSRITDYASMLPGGMSFMWTATVESRGAALRGERHLLRALEAIDGFEAVGGEWFKCDPFGKNLAIDELLKIGNEHVQVRCVQMPKFKDRERKKD